MKFRLLGPIEVEDEDRLLDLDGLRERTVLALLLLHEDEFISTDTLISRIWGDRPPATARHTIEVLISRLRKTLAVGGDECSIVTSPGGYILRIVPDALDLRRFEHLFDEGREALAADEPATAREKLDAALALWRGPALADLADEPFAETEARRLEELRLAAVEARLEAALRLGRHSELVGDLQSLVAEHPLRERFRAQLMLTLYRSGRQADALSVYRDGRHRLVDELGIEPSRELQELEQAILRHDQALQPPPSSTGAPIPPAACLLAEAYYDLGRLEEADAWACRAAAGSSDDIPLAEMAWRQVRAKVLAQRGRHAQAERLAREAVAIAETTETLSAQADAYRDLAEVLSLAGRDREAAESLNEALARDEQVENPSPGSNGPAQGFPGSPLRDRTDVRCSFRRDR